MDINLYLDADPDQREQQIGAFQSSHDEWQEYKRIIQLHETNAVSLTDDDVKQLLGEESNKKDDGTKLTLKSLAHSLFQPGMKYIGTICIPSLGDDVGHAHDSDSDDGDDTVIIDTVNDTDTVNDEQPVDNAGENTATDSDAQLETGDRTTTSPNPSGVEQYELVILEKGTDEFGNDFILGAHTAYHDTQCVHINYHIRDANGQTSEEVLDIEYEDEETCIKGSWNPSSCCLEGYVRQRLQANDGAFHTSDEVTHVFTLYPCTYQCPRGRGVRSEQSSFQEDLLSVKTRAVVELRNRANSKGFESADNYNDLFKPDGLKIEFEDLQALKHKRALSATDNVQIRSIWKLRGSNWEDLSNCCSMISEKTCARFRYRTSLLDRTSFGSGDEQRVFFEKWKRVGFCLAKAHAEWDSCDNSTARVFSIAFVLCRNLQIVSSSLQSMMYKSRRLGQNYDMLESSWRRANARKPTDFLTQFEVSSHEVSRQFTCSICFEGVANEGEEDLALALYKLPCSHCFHGACLQKWFHNSHVTCPICRAPVTDPDKK
mmetsp:Transcript_8636/g.13016  ORF Transcript_8636/g.13016 Transcript_8636/m.13016 type:complete len:544 (-) Transcript_8636:1630-3261(-)